MPPNARSYLEITPENFQKLATHKEQYDNMW